MTKIEQLADIEGMEIEEMLEEASFDSVCSGICMNKGCDYTTQVEPDCADGLCEVCHTHTVQSALIIMGLI